MTKILKSVIATTKTITKVIVRFVRYEYKFLFKNL